MEIRFLFIEVKKEYVWLVLIDLSDFSIELIGLFHLMLNSFLFFLCVSGKMILFIEVKERSFVLVKRKILFY